MTSPSLYRGFSMIEILVTIVLICIGLLGIAAMQVRTITYTQDLVQRNNAVMLADELLEILRADSANLADYYKAAGDDFPSAPANCTPLPKTATQRLGCWAAHAQATLPDAKSLVTSNFHIIKQGSATEVKLAWRVKAGECLDDSGYAGADNTICHYTIKTEI